MKRFYLQRNTDASGVSGTGKVAEGCQFDTGWCALVWLTGKAAMSFYPDIETLEGIHGHQGMTRVIWVDGESSNFVIQREERPGNRARVTVKGRRLDGRRRSKKTSAVYCEHANECPAVCPCPDDCYCKDHTCKIE